ncbi:mannitol dehydrogenase family protein [Candidatus Poribacteria bacterium]|nr:mannitol dehydrogenase family protein [Candidatus Poribacteria bacterium]
MAVLTEKGLTDSYWQKIGIKIPGFNIASMKKRTKASPRWIHLAPSNLFRAMVAPIQQQLLEIGAVDYGMIAVETYDQEVIEQIYKPHDNLSLQVVMYPDRRKDLMVVSNIADSVFADAGSNHSEWERALNYFACPELQMVSITCTEKGYDIQNDQAKWDLKNGYECPEHIMAKAAAFAYHRYKNGRYPIAFVSMDNVSENGLKFSNAVMTFCRRWVDDGVMDPGFMYYLNSEVSFPWTMIDRITPRPAENVKEMLEDKDIEGMDIITTAKGTVIAPFVNTEHISYLVIQDDFPNGRPPLEKAGVVFCHSPEDVARYEKMKVGACLNPIQTTLCIFGCLFNQEHIYNTIADPLLKKLVYRQSYDESLPVVVHPGGIEPEEFLREVLEERLPNPNIPDTPARIITDTSQKVGVRYGDTIIAHGENAKKLICIPLAIAGWCRYLMGIDDDGNLMNYNPAAPPPLNRWSPDHLLEKLTGFVSGIKLGVPESAGDKLKPILADSELFGVDLYTVGLGDKIEYYFREMIKGTGSVRKTLNKQLS